MLTCTHGHPEMPDTLNWKLQKISSQFPYHSPSRDITFLFLAFFSVLVICTNAAALPVTNCFYKNKVLEEKTAKAKLNKRDYIKLNFCMAKEITSKMKRQLTE